jgi:hypothetical protein
MESRPTLGRYGGWRAPPEGRQGTGRGAGGGEGDSATPEGRQKGGGLGTWEVGEKSLRSGPDASEREVESGVVLVMALDVYVVEHDWPRLRSPRSLYPSATQTF